MTNRTTEKHEIKRNCVWFGKSSKTISLVNTRQYIFTRRFATRETISSGVHSWNIFSIFHRKKQISSIYLFIYLLNFETKSDILETLLQKTLNEFEINVKNLERKICYSKPRETLLYLDKPITVRYELLWSNKSLELVQLL